MNRIVLLCWCVIRPRGAFSVPLHCLVLSQVVEPDLERLMAVNTPEARAKLREQAAAHAMQISELLLRIPRPLLLLLKTNDCLRTIDLLLGQPVNTFIITARECTRALAEMRYERGPKLGGWLLAQADMLRVELLMLGMRALVWSIGVQRVLGLSPPSQGSPSLSPEYTADMAAVGINVDAAAAQRMGAAAA